MSRSAVPRRVRHRFLRPLGAAVLVVGALTVGCASPGTTAQPDTGGGPVFEHVHGLGVDPADGRTYVATHDGLFRSTADGRLEPIGARGRDLMGFTVAGPATFLSSGHPGPQEQVADPLGLIRTTDAATTWTTLSLAGEVDFHALDTSNGTVYGLDASRGVLRLSSDGGSTWQDRAAVPALDIAVDPAEPATVLATVRGGISTSTDGGTTFSAPAGPQLAFLSWAPDGSLYGLGVDSRLHVSTDRGESWQQVGTVRGGTPQALTALADERVLAATAAGVHDSRDGGRTFDRLG